MPSEQSAPGMDAIVDLSKDIEILGSGYGAELSHIGVPWWPCEGPLWWKEGGYLLFSDIGQSRRHRYNPGEGITVDRDPTDNANGLTRDIQGRLIACEHGSRRVTRLEPDGTITVVAATYRGVRLNRPNDVVVKSDGSIYFTDPGAPGPDFDLDFSGVYRVSADLGNITCIVKDFVTPNGLCFSPDESILYINDSRGRNIRAFDMQPNGTLALASDRVFCDMSGDSRPGVADGMKCDVQGNVYCTGPGGIWVIDPSGKRLGTILMGDKHCTNIGWGGDDWKTLYFTTRTEMGQIPTKATGVAVPSKR